MDSTRPGKRFRTATVLWCVAMFGWIALEGNLPVDIFLSVSGVVLLAVSIWSQTGAGARTAPWRWVMAAVIGLAGGAAAALGTLLLMALKTGLHSHGPEYSPEQIAWVWGQLGLWAAVGLLVGLGVALLAAGWSSWTHRPPD